jgi:hypothetical protein
MVRRERRWISAAGKTGSGLIATVGKNRLRLLDSSVEPLMKTAISLFFVALASGGTLGAKSGVAKPAVVGTTVCDLVKRSTNFEKVNWPPAGRGWQGTRLHVQVRAIVMSDLIEHTMLVDNDCPASGISLWIPHELDDSTDVRALRSELRSQWAIPPNNTQVSTVFDGTLLREHRKLYLKVLSIDHIDLVPNGW